MIDIKLIRTNFDYVQKKLLERQVDPLLIKQLKDTSINYHYLKQKEEELQAIRNNLSKQISSAYSQNKQSEARDLTESMQNIKHDLNQLAIEVQAASEAFHSTLYQIPNIADDSVPIGVDESENVISFKTGLLPQFDFIPKTHWELAESLGLVDFELGPKLSGTRYVVYQGIGAKLYQALINFTIDHQVLKNNYKQYIVPVIVQDKTLFNTAQLPKFKDDLFEVHGKYLSSTGESQLVNLYSGMIIDSQKLPLKLTTNSLCFRKESGAAGKDTRGLMRLHQFQKTELVIICQAKDSWKQLEQITENAESILKSLHLPFQRVVLCTGDLGFAAAKTYDLEVWLPSANLYREISSCSNTLDFQSKRALIRCRSSVGEKTEYVHCLNASGVAIDRLFAAVLENYQQSDGSVRIPDALLPYMNNITVIRPIKE